MELQYKHYQYFIDKYTPEDSMYVGWSTKEKQEKCFKALHDELGNFAKVLDVGCGVGDFSRHSLSYVGIDINQEYINQANLKHPNDKFICKSLERYHSEHDYVVACGTFNLKVDNQLRYLTECIEQMYEIANKGIAFTLMSRHSDTKHDNLFYYDPGQIFNICKHRYKKVKLDHTYLEDDFMVVIEK